MNDELLLALQSKGADIVSFVDISELPKDRTLGFDKAILICMALSREFIMKKKNDLPTDEDEFLITEHKIEDLADWLADYIEQKGFKAHSQSEIRNRMNGFIERGFIDPSLEQGVSILPQKTIARLAGIGFIGKSNLLITEKYGSAFCMCSVLTDAPLLTENLPVASSKCGSCDACVTICPLNALSGNSWTEEGGRESLVDVSKCVCSLKCVIACPWTLKYAKQI